MKRQIVCAVLLSAVCLCPAQSSGQDLPFDLPSPEWGASRESRRVMAGHWLRELESIDDNIATLSPAEAAWLKLEYDDELAGNQGSFTPRSLAAYRSIELAKRESKRGVGYILRTLRELASPVGGIDDNVETLLWMELCISGVTDSTLWSRISTLVEEGILFGDGPGANLVVGDIEVFFMYLWAFRVESITREVTLPWINSRVLASR